MSSLAAAQSAAPGVLIRGAQLVPCDGSPVAPGLDLRVREGRIAELAPGLQAVPGERVVEAQGRVLMPGFVDAHTHAAFAGDRLDEFELRLRGASYSEILKAGGGILSTVRAVRRASESELLEALGERLDCMLREGTTSVEVKSGYGLDTPSELKLLRVIARAAERFAGTVSVTALLGHALDPDCADPVRRAVEETLPAVHSEFPGVSIDAYLDDGAWSLADCRRLFERARALGHPLRLHADQFQRLGGLGLACELGLSSVDHLEASSSEELVALAARGIRGVILPVSGLHLDGRYANARPFVEAGGKLVIASNFNPGSAPSSSMPLAIALAVRHSGVTLEQALTATTQHAAELLGLGDRGRIARGLRADLILLRHRDPRLLGYELGGNPVDLVMVEGRILHERAS